MKKRKLSVLCALLAGVLTVGAVGIAPMQSYAAEQTITHQEMMDKLEGGWLGAFWANWTGLPTEFKYVNEPGPEGSVVWAIADTYATDDDTSMEYTFLHMMEVYGVNDITYADMPAEWLFHLQDYIWEGNYEARTLMAQGYLPPQTGMIGINPRAEAIDAQVECEVLGMITPGMLQNCYERTRWWMAAVGDGVVLDTSAFYSMLCANAFVEDDIHDSLATVRSYFADQSETARMHDDVKALYQANPDDWRAARRALHHKYYTGYVLDSRINFLATILALYYGEGDYKKTVEIAVLAGYDNDCNAATSATVLGITHGKSGLPQELLQNSGEAYRNTNRPGLNSSDVNTIATRIAAQAEKVIINAGGSKVEDGYVIKDAPFTPRDNDGGYTRKIVSTAQNWSYDGMNKFYNASYESGYGYGTMRKDAYAEVTFSGTRVGIVGTTSVNGGRFAVTVDGVSFGTVDLSAESVFVSGRSFPVCYDQMLLKIRDLPTGTHTLRLTALDEGKWHSIDYIEVECSEDEYYADGSLNYARTPIATAISSINGALGTGSGSGGLNVIRDGVYYAPNGHSSTQYDTFLGFQGNGALYPHDFEDYVGYTFTREVTLATLVFNEGGNWGENGGWFANGEVRIEVLVNGEWIAVDATVSPTYPNGNSAAVFGAGGDTYTFTFEPIAVTGIRIIGTPGGVQKLISCGELEVYGEV